MDIDYGALFGIGEGENGQEAADPAAEAGQAQGAEEQEAADPAEEEQDADNSEGTDAETGSEASKEGGQSAEENSRFAAARRKAERERDAAIARARQDAQEEARLAIDEAFKNCGLTDPYTKKPINSKAEYDAYRARFDTERKKQIAKKSGMTDGEFEDFIANLPEVREAKRAQQEAEAAGRQARESQAKARLDEQLRSIGELDPSIRELGDLAKMETYPKFYELVKKGNDLVDAFKLANYDALAGKTAAASRQAAINAAQSKQHLGQTNARGAGAVSVPADIKEAYRAFNPDATDAEIQQHYNKYTKK